MQAPPDATRPKAAAERAFSIASANSLVLMACVELSSSMKERVMRGSHFSSSTMAAGAARLQASGEQAAAVWLAAAAAAAPAAAS